MNRSSIGRVRRLHPFRSRYLHPNHHCCQLLQSDVWTLLTSLTLKSESAIASRSTISSARKPKNRLSLSESLKRSVLKTGNAFLRVNFQKVSHFRFEHKDNAKWHGRSSRSLVLLLFMRFSWDCTEISVYGTSKVYRLRPDVLGRFAHDSTQTFSDAAPCKGLTPQQHASVSQGRICSDNFTCCHTEIEVADQTFYLTQSQYTDTGLTSPSSDPITSGAWQGSHWSANF